MQIVLRFRRDAIAGSLNNQRSVALLATPRWSGHADYLLARCRPENSLAMVAHSVAAACLDTVKDLTLFFALFRRLSSVCMLGRLPAYPGERFPHH